MSNDIEITGLDELMTDLENLQHNIPEKIEVSMDMLFNDNFMREHTKFKNFQEMLDKSNFKIETEEDFKAVPDDKWDMYINQNTDFNNWQEMGDFAQQKYLENVNDDIVKNI